MKKIKYKRYTSRWMLFSVFLDLFPKIKTRLEISENRRNHTKKNQAGKKTCRIVRTAEGGNFAEKWQNQTAAKKAAKNNNTD